MHHPYSNLLLRIKVDDSKSLCKFNCKFGVDIEDVCDLLKFAKELKLNIIGVSFHVGSGCADSNVYRSALENCKCVFDIAKKIGFIMNLIDIGGGFPGFDNSSKFEDMAIVINTAIDELFKDTDVKFIAEPGRYFVTSSHTLVVTVINKKEFVDNGAKKYTYYISEGVYGSFSGIIFDYSKIELKPYNNNASQKYSSTVFGPTCDSIDVVAKECELPVLEIGDKLFVENIGAYSIASGTEFNGFSLPKCYYIMT
jgi:ornithine decarboxylase